MNSLGKYKGNAWTHLYMEILVNKCMFSRVEHSLRSAQTLLSRFIFVAIKLCSDQAAGLLAEQIGLIL